MFKTMSLKGKILGICITLSAFSVVVGGIGIYSLKEVIAKYGKIAKVNLPNSATLGKMRAEYRNTRVGITILAVKDLSSEDRESGLEKMKTSIENYHKADKEYNEIPFMPGEEEVYKLVNDSWKKYEAFSDRIVAAYHNPAQKDKIYTMLHEGNDISLSFSANIEKLLKFHSEAAKTSVDEASSISEWSITLMGFLIAASMVVSGVIAISFSGALGKTLTDLANRLTLGANEVASASEQVSGASESLSSSANQQAAALQETAASVEELSATITKNSENAAESRETSENSHNVASRGKTAMEEMTQAISEIQESTSEMVKQIEASNQEVAEITKVIAEIGNKTKVINDIVFQTKLLSFNASVEAARAGEHGKGFAVVAEEVGNLAAMSGNSAREITTMLESSIDKVEKIVTDSKSKIEVLVKNGTEKVTKGTEIAKRCGDILNEVVHNASSVNERISQISSASKEQENGVREISKAMEQLNQVTHMNAAASQQAASASSELSAQAETLRTGVKDLEKLISGSAEEGYSSAPAERKVSTSHFKTTFPPAKQTASKVVTFKPKEKKLEERLPSVTVKKAVGSSLPSDTDPRFSDV